MVMGPTHALSGATFALAAIAAFNATVAVTPLHPTIAILGTVVAAGAARAPDIDSYSSTVVRSFGIFGRLGYMIANGIGLGVYNATRTKYDGAVENGHRTFFHTGIMAIIMGAIVAALTAPTNIIEVFGKEFTLGQFNAIIILGIFLNLAMAGLLEKQIKRARKSFGPYILMLVSTVIAAIIAIYMPGADGKETGFGSYAWLGIAVAFGWFIHLLGDLITKMGVSLFWPIKIRGKRWYDVSLPSFMRISAGGTFEKVILFPVLAILTALLFGWNLVMYFAA